MSRIVATSSPTPERARIADSRPLPGPLTNTSTRRKPRSKASFAAAEHATCAAYGVFLRLPLKPILPEEAHEMVFPYWSVMVTNTLLNVARMCAWPFDSTTTFFLRTWRALPRPPDRCCCLAISDRNMQDENSGAGSEYRTHRKIGYGYLRGAFFLPATVLRRPLRVRALVFVR